MPKAGQGRNYLQRQQSEGYYDRVDGHGFEADRPIEERNVPAYVLARNAQRRAETALAVKQLPVPGKGSQGYSAAKGKGKGQKRPHESTNSWETGDRTKGAPAAPAWTANATWWAATASTWWSANSTKTEEVNNDVSWLYPVLCIFLLGALFGGAVGYLVGYIRHYKVIILPRPPRPPPAIHPAAPRNRRPQATVPDKIVITKTGGAFHHVSGCSSTTCGEEARSNRTLDKCGHCFPAFREE